MQDKVVPGAKWDFNEEVTEAFDDMLARSIPDYEGMRKACLRVATRFLKSRAISSTPRILDLGASRGESVDALIKRFGALAVFELLETSSPMLDVLNNRFKGFIAEGVVEVNPSKVTTSIPNRRYALVQSILTLQFIPINYRQQIVGSIYRALEPGGAFILVEKVLGDGGEIDDLMVAEYHDLKKENGYSYEDIERKKASLEGVLVPITARWNMDLMEKAGFTQVDCFWRWMNFAAWVGIKA